MARQNYKKENDELVIKTATETVLKTKGVAGLANRGVKIDRSKKELELNVHIIVNFESKIPEVAWDLQENIKSAVDTIPDANLNKVNIMIQGVE